MDKTSKEINEILKSQKLGVLSTHIHGQPYANLIAFAASEDIRHIVFATPQKSQKYENIILDDRCALLIDSSQNSVEDFKSAMAITAIGRARPIDKSRENHLVELYLQKHPNLVEFINSQKTVMFCLEISRCHIVNNFQQTSVIDF